MAVLSVEELGRLLAPFYEPDELLLMKLSLYLELLLKWNARTNLTAIRDPAEIVRRHFGESLFAARHVPVCETLLDFGSGAGFPGIPIQLARPEIRVTLAESQGKKAAFLREAVRVLGLGGSAEVWSGRVEAMPPSRMFDVVALRAVDDPEGALRGAASRVRPGGVIVHLTTLPLPEGLASERIPGSANGVVSIRNT